MLITQIRKCNHWEGPCFTQQGGDLAAPDSRVAGEDAPYTWDPVKGSGPHVGALHSLHGAAALPRHQQAQAPRRGGVG